MVRAGAHHGSAFALLVRHDVPASTLDRQGAYIVGADVVIGVEPLFQGVLAVDVGMVDDQQRAAGCHQVEEPLLDLGGRRAQQRGIHGADQVVRRVRQRSIEESRGDALHLHTGVGGQRLGVFHRFGRDVQRGDLPALTRQPYRVRTFAAPHVEGATRAELRHLCEEGAVRIAAPDPLA
jgi:hypothetical protein